MSIKDLNVVVVGGGIIGSLVARQLDDVVDSIVVVDKVELPPNDFYCIDYAQLELSPETMDEFGKLLGNIPEPRLVIDCTYGVSTVDMVNVCQWHNAMYINTSIEDWIDSTERSTSKLLNDTRKALSKFVGDRPTTLVCHGANPGMVNHMVKAALSKATGESPDTKDGWAELFNRTAKSIVFSEIDTQVFSKVLAPREFASPWCPYSMCEEVCIDYPEYISCGEVVVANDRDMWSHFDGEYMVKGFLTPHMEVNMAADYFGVKHVQFIYRPSPVTISCIMDNTPRKFVPLLRQDYIDGADKISVTISMKDNTFCTMSSTLDGNGIPVWGTPTSVQVVSGIMAAIVWMGNNRASGYVEPDDLPHQEILNNASTYWKMDYNEY